LRTRPTFSRSLIVSVGVSALGTTSIHFIEPGVKVIGQYYREDLMMQKLLLTVKLLRVSTVELLTMETTEFIPHTQWSNYGGGLRGPESPGGPLVTPGLRGYKGASKRPP